MFGSLLWIYNFVVGYILFKITPDLFKFEPYPPWNRDLATYSEPLVLDRIYSFEENKNSIITTYPLLESQIDSEFIVRFQYGFSEITSQQYKTSMKIPKFEDRDTLTSLALLSTQEYITTGNNLNNLAMKGYIFTNPSRSLVVFSLMDPIPLSISFSKGSNSHNHNIMFSCCCAYVDFTWEPVCPCYIDGNHCSFNCLSEYAQGNRIGFLNTRMSMGEPDTSFSPLYFHQAKEIYKRLIQDFLEASIWIIGHSISGSLASLLGATYSVDFVVAFSAPGEKMFATRLAIPEGKYSNIFHIYENDDPIPNGECKGVSSYCYFAGYALESKCHLGKVCKFGSPDMKYDIKKHHVNSLIKAILDEPFPICTEESTCIDCQQWNFL